MYKRQLQEALDDSEARERQIRAAELHRENEVVADARLEVSSARALFRQESLQHNERIAENTAQIRESWAAQARRACSTADLRAEWFEREALQFWERERHRAVESEEARQYFVRVLRDAEQEHSQAMSRLELACAHSLEVRDSRHQSELQERGVIS